MSWLVERRKGRIFEEIMRMLQVLTPLEETRAYPKRMAGQSRCSSGGMVRGMRQLNRLKRFVCSNN